MCIYSTRVLNNNTDHYRAQYHYICGNRKPSYLFSKNARWFLKLFYTIQKIGSTARLSSRFVGSVSSNRNNFVEGAIRAWVTRKNYSRVFPQNSYFSSISSISTSPGNFRWIWKNWRGDDRCVATRRQRDRMISSAFRRVLRVVCTRENCREYRSESRVCVSFTGPDICCTHTDIRTHFIASMLHIYSGAAVQSNLELSLSNTSRVLGRCLRSGFTSFLRRTADIIGGKRRVRYRSLASWSANRKKNIASTELRLRLRIGSRAPAVDYTLKLCSFRRCLLAAGLSMRRRSGRDRVNFWENRGV